MYGKRQLGPFQSASPSSMISPTTKPCCSPSVLQPASRWGLEDRWTTGNHLRGRGYPWNTEGAWKTKDLNGFFQDVDDLWMCRKRPIQRVWKVDKEGSSNSWWRPDPCTHLKDQVKWPSYSDAICSTCGMDFPLHASVATSPRIQEFEVILRNVCPSQKKTKKRPMFSCSGTSTFFLCETSRQAIHRFPTSSATREPAGVGADARHGTLVHIVTVASEVDNGGTSRRRSSTAGGDGEPLPSRSNNAEFGWFRPIPNICSL